MASASQPENAMPPDANYGIKWISESNPCRSTPKCAILGVDQYTNASFDWLNNNTEQHFFKNQSAVLLDLNGIMPIHGTTGIAWH